MPGTINATDKARARRIKQHVIGREQRFFVVTPPGLEPLCQRELMGLGIPPGDIVLRKGGLAFTGRLTACYQANLMCRTAGHILMRLQSFTARHFDALEKHARAIPWELYLSTTTALEVRVSAHQSRLYHSDAVAERIFSAVKERLASGLPDDAGPIASEVPAQRIWARLHKDRVTLSLDSSGDHLHKRGLKTHGGPAPLRETLAAAAMLLAGYDGSGILCDPMCGSGTFAVEAAMMVKRIPPGWYRTFAFMEWPAFRPAHWDYLRHQAAPRSNPLAAPLIYAADRSRTAVEQLAALLQGSDIEDAIDLQKKDFFGFTPPPLGSHRGVIALNPPYGRRLGQAAATPRLVGEILHKLQRDFRGWQIILVLPEKRLLYQVPFTFKSHHTMHGGRPIWLVIGRVPL
jgi:putative N6-adenine-specific DNA methylase